MKEAYNQHDNSNGPVEDEVTAIFEELAAYLKMNSPEVMKEEPTRNTPTHNCTREQTSTNFENVLVERSGFIVGIFPFAESVTPFNSTYNPDEKSTVNQVYENIEPMSAACSLVTFAPVVHESPYELFESSNSDVFDLNCAPVVQFLKVDKSGFVQKVYSTIESIFYEEHSSDADSPHQVDHDSYEKVVSSADVYSIKEIYTISDKCYFHDFPHTVATASVHRLTPSIDVYTAMQHFAIVDVKSNQYSKRVLTPDLIRFADISFEVLSSEEVSAILEICPIYAVLSTVAPTTIRNNYATSAQVIVETSPNKSRSVENYAHKFETLRAQAVSFVVSSAVERVLPIPGTATPHHCATAPITAPITALITAPLPPRTNTAVSISLAWQTDEAGTFSEAWPYGKCAPVETPPLSNDFSRSQAACTIENLNILAINTYISDDSQDSTDDSDYLVDVEVVSVMREPSNDSRTLCTDRSQSSVSVCETSLKGEYNCLKSEAFDEIVPNDSTLSIENMQELGNLPFESVSHDAVDGVAVEPVTEAETYCCIQ